MESEDEQLLVVAVEHEVCDAVRFLAELKRDRLYDTVAYPHLEQLAAGSLPEDYSPLVTEPDHPPEGFLGDVVIVQLRQDSDLGRVFLVVPSHLSHLQVARLSYKHAIDACLGVECRIDLDLFFFPLCG